MGDTEKLDAPKSGPPSAKVPSEAGPGPESTTTPVESRDDAPASADSNPERPPVRRSSLRPAPASFRPRPRDPAQLRPAMVIHAGDADPSDTSWDIADPSPSHPSQVPLEGTAPLEPFALAEDLQPPPADVAIPPAATLPREMRPRPAVRHQTLENFAIAQPRDREGSRSDSARPPILEASESPGLDSSATESSPSRSAHFRSTESATPSSAQLDADRPRSSPPVGETASTPPGASTASTQQLPAKEDLRSEAPTTDVDGRTEDTGQPSQSDVRELSRGSVAAKHPSVAGHQPPPDAPVGPANPAAAASDAAVTPMSRGVIAAILTPLVLVGVVAATWLGRGKPHEPAVASSVSRVDHVPLDMPTQASQQHLAVVTTPSASTEAASAMASSANSELPTDTASAAASDKAPEPVASAPSPSATTTPQTTAPKTKRVTLDLKPLDAKVYYHGMAQPGPPYVFDVAKGQRIAVEVSRFGFVTRKVIIDDKKPVVTVGMVRLPAPKRPPQ